MKKNIAIVTGGYSGEAVISYKTAKNIADHIDKTSFELYIIDVNPKGWFYIADGQAPVAVNRNDFSIIVKEQIVNFDAVFIALHGTPGEDGKLQGYFDILGIPYTGCDVTTSAITFNKRYAIAVAALGGVAVASSVHLFKDNVPDIAKLAATFQYPVFVKPNNGGSSIGMSKVLEADKLAAAVEKAFAEDSQVLIEEMIQGREFTIGVYRKDGEIKTLPFTEIVVEESQVFFDFEAKYDGKSKEITPAVVEEAIAAKVRAAAQKVYQLFNCKGVVRIDFIYNEQKGVPFMLEINTIPGQSKVSLIPQQIAASGLSLEEFYTALVWEALNSNAKN